MDVRRQWKKHDVGYHSCGFFHVFRHSLTSEWAITDENGKLLAVVPTLTAARKWISANWRQIEHDRSLCPECQCYDWHLARCSRR